MFNGENRVKWTYTLHCMKEHVRHAAVPEFYAMTLILLHSLRVPSKSFLPVSN